MKEIIKKFGIICLLFVLLLPNILVAQNSIPEKKMGWWEDARFGMFLHWGIYSKIAGEWKGSKDYHEFVMLQAKIPLREYAAYAATFNPIKFNAEKWVLAAKNAGMKYMVYTSKHSDGFSMYRSEASSYNIYDVTPFKRDPLMELADACKKYKMKLGIYYSLGRDWADPDVPTNWPTKGGRSNTWDFPNEDAKDFSKYFERKVKPQIKELMTKYKPAILWFDVPEMANSGQSQELRNLILGIDPDCIINDRIGNRKGDYKTLEQTSSGNIIPGDWETCITMSKKWGYMKYDTIFKSSEKLIGLLVDAASKGGNLLLNVGPTAEGEFRPQNLERLNTIGKWISINGEAIYGTKPWKIFGENADSAAYKAAETFKPEEMDANFDGTPKDVVQDVRFTTNGEYLYVIARSWRAKDIVINSLTSANNQIKFLNLLGYKGKLNWKQTAAGTKIEIPEKAQKGLPVYVFKVKL